jgi:hypothetical protein
MECIPSIPVPRKAETPNSTTAPLEAVTIGPSSEAMLTDITKSAVDLKFRSGSLSLILVFFLSFFLINGK